MGVDICDIFLVELHNNGLYYVTGKPDREIMIHFVVRYDCNHIYRYITDMASVWDMSIDKSRIPTMTDEIYFLSHAIMVPAIRGKEVFLEDDIYIN